MTEQLKHSSINQYSHKPEIDSSNENGFRLNRKGRLVRTGAGVLLATGVITGGVNIFHETTVDTGIGTVPAGEGTINTIDDVVRDLAAKNNFDPSSVHDIVGAGQEVAAELDAVHPGQPVQPGDQIEVTVVKNGLGQLSVQADPTNLAHLDK
jgi:hypothetical protein